VIIALSLTALCLTISSRVDLDNLELTYCKFIRSPWRDGYSVRV
jgi:hypothetical protein